MKRLALAISVLAVSTTGALANPVYNWTGFYLGGNLGYSWGRSASTLWFTDAVTTVSSAALTPVAGSASSTTTRVGWTIGAGIEGVVSGNWTAKLEYLYVDLGDVSGAFRHAGHRSQRRLADQQIQLAYHRQHSAGRPELSLGGPVSPKRRAGTGKRVGLAGKAADALEGPTIAERSSPLG